MTDLATLDHAAIERLVPHKGAMCLLDRVIAFAAEHIEAEAPLATAQHPLRRDGRLPAIACAEMGLQAMALHGALVDGVSQRPGLVASLAALEIYRAWAADERFAVRAELLSRNPQGFAYRFAVRQRAAPLVEGRATIMFPDLETVLR
jgi:predicted hotdog family 3-hydroxylacyl-ACP dehydratase